MWEGIELKYTGGWMELRGGFDRAQVYRRV